MMMFKSSHRKDTKNYVKLNIVNLDFNVSIWRVFRHTGKELELTEKNMATSKEKVPKNEPLVIKAFTCNRTAPKILSRKEKGGLRSKFFFLSLQPSLPQFLEIKMDSSNGNDSTATIIFPQKFSTISQSMSNFKPPKLVYNALYVLSRFGSEILRAFRETKWVGDFKSSRQRRYTPNRHDSYLRKIAILQQKIVNSVVTLAPIWLPHWPACIWTISLMVLGDF